MNSVRIGGRERAVIDLARRGMAKGDTHALALFDTAYEARHLDLDPGAVPWTLLPRRPGIDLRYVLTLRRYALTFDADVLHAHNDTAVFYAGLAALLPGPRRICVIGTFHTWPAASSAWARRATRRASMGAARCTAVSDELARRLVTEGWVRHCDVIRNGVDLAAFAPRPIDARWRTLLQARGHRFLVGGIARLTPVKAHACLLAAAENLHKTHPDLLIAVAGDGELRPMIEDAAARLPNILYLGNVDDMPGLLSALDAVVLASEHEGMPLALLEAMAMGLPVAATHVGGVPEIVHHGRSGLLVPPGNPEALAAALARLADDERLRSALARNSPKAASRFSLERTFHAYSGLYEDVAPSRPDVRTSGGSAGAS